MVDVAAVVAALTVLVVLMVSAVPVAFSLAIAGVVGLIVEGGVGTAGAAATTIPFSTTASYTLTMVPMFILMGLFAGHSGMLEDVFAIAQRLLRRVPGGLPAAASLAGVVFGGISGSSVADAATIGRLSIGEMTRQGYRKEFAAAVVAAGGTAAILIPPSIALVVFGISTGESVGRLLLAGIVPGLLTAVVEVGIIMLVARRQLIPAAGGGVPGATVSPEPLRLAMLVGPACALVLMLTVVGGLYAGIFTPTEAAGVGAAAAVVLSAAYCSFNRRRDSQSRTFTGTAAAALRETAGLTASVFFLIVGSAIFTNFLVVSGVPAALTEWILGVAMPPWAVVALFLLLLIPLGMFLDGLSMLLIVTPLAYPVVSGLGFDGLWMGVLFVKMIEIGLITPPVGLNVFVVAGLDRELSVDKVFRRVVPFVVSDLVVVALLFLFPSITTWLPSHVG